MFLTTDPVRRLVILSILFLNGFLGLAIWVSVQSISLDFQIRQYIHETKSPMLTLFFEKITELGSTKIALMVVIPMLLYLVIKNRWIDISIFVVLISSSLLLTMFFKELIQRPRPVADAFGLVSYSFPSAHAVTSLAVYGFLIYLCLKSERSKVTKVGVSLFLGTIIFLVSISRVYLDVHYFTDILAGCLLGVFCFCLSLLIFARSFYVSTVETNK